MVITDFSGYHARGSKTNRIPWIKLKRPMRYIGMLFFILLWTMAAFASQSTVLNVHVRFEQVFRLQQGDRVLNAAQPIGYVKMIAYLPEGYFNVTLAVDGGFASDISEYSRFVIVNDPWVNDRKAIRVVQTREGGNPLKNGAWVEGSDKYSVFFDDMKGDIQDGVDDLKKGMNEFSEEIQGLSENEKVKALKKEMERLAEAMRDASKEIQEKLRKEILPLLKQDLEKLREQLRKFGREEEMKPLDEEMKKISHV